MSVSGKWRQPQAPIPGAERRRLCVTVSVSERVTNHGEIAAGVPSNRLRLRLRASALIFDLISVSVPVACFWLVGQLAGIAGFWAALLLLATFGVFTALSLCLTQGETVGKAACGLQVQRVDGVRLATTRQSLVWALGRQLVGYSVFDIFGLGSLVALFDRRGRALHDMAFSSQVVLRDDARRTSSQDRLKDYSERFDLAIEEVKERYRWCLGPWKWLNRIAVLLLLWALGLKRVAAIIDQAIVSREQEAPTPPAIEDATMTPSDPGAGRVRDLVTARSAAIVIGVTGTVVALPIVDRLDIPVIERTLVPAALGVPGYGTFFESKPDSRFRADVLLSLETDAVAVSIRRGGIERFLYSDGASAVVGHLQEILGPGNTERYEADYGPGCGGIRAFVVSSWDGLSIVSDEHAGSFTIHLYEPQVAALDVSGIGVRIGESESVVRARFGEKVVDEDDRSQGDRSIRVVVVNPVQPELNPERPEFDREEFEIRALAGSISGTKLLFENGRFSGLVAAEPLVDVC